MWWVYNQEKYFYSYSEGIDSSRHVYRLQILTTRVDPPRCKGNLFKH